MKYHEKRQRNFTKNTRSTCDILSEIWSFQKSGLVLLVPMRSDFLGYTVK